MEDGKDLFIASFDLTIASMTITEKVDIPTTCLQLPPTLCVGNLLLDDNSSEVFGEPDISYHLIAQADVRESFTWQHTTTRTEIPIMVAGDANPPLDTDDFPQEFMQTSINPCRLDIFHLETGEMTLTTTECTPIVFAEGRNEGSTMSYIKLHLLLQRPEPDIRRWLSALQHTSMSVSPRLRIKTFYSSQIFPKLPDQAMLSGNSPVNLHTKTHTLRSIKQSLAHCKWGPAPGPSDKSGNAMQSTALVTQLQVPITVRKRLAPSFCSAVVARQYSLLLICKIGGLHARKFVLEAPIQLAYMRDNTLANQTGAAIQASETHLATNSMINAAVSASHRLRLPVAITRSDYRAQAFQEAALPSYFR